MGRPRNPLEGRGEQAHESAERRHAQDLEPARAMLTYINRIATLAKEDPARKFYSIAHLITEERLRQAFWKTPKRRQRRNRRGRAFTIRDQCRGEYGHRQVLVKGYVHRVEIICGSEVIASHPRSYDREGAIYDPVHYLALLEQKSRALD